MRVRDLERLLVAHDAPASYLGTVTRVLREGIPQLRLPVAGRGVNAPHIGPDEAAWVLLGLAGTDVAAQAGNALARLLELRLPAGVAPRSGMPEFVDSVQMILRDPELAWSVVEIRVGRSCPHSQIIYRDGHIEHFVLEGVAPSAAPSVGAMKFRSEGVVSGGVLQSIAEALFAFAAGATADEQDSAGAANGAEAETEAA